MTHTHIYIYYIYILIYIQLIIYMLATKDCFSAQKSSNVISVSTTRQNFIELHQLGLRKLPKCLGDG